MNRPIHRLQTESSVLAEASNVASSQAKLDSTVDHAEELLRHDRLQTVPPHSLRERVEKAARALPPEPAKPSRKWWKRIL